MKRSDRTLKVTRDIDCRRVLLRARVAYAARTAIYHASVNLTAGMFNHFPLSRTFVEGPAVKCNVRPSVCVFHF